MPRFILLMMMIIVIPIAALSQTVELLNKYEIPTYGYHSLLLSSPDLFDFHKTSYSEMDVKFTNIHAGIMMTEYSVKQSPSSNSIFSGYITFDYFSNKQERNGNTVLDDDRLQLNLYLTASSNRYFNDDRGMFLHLGLDLAQDWNLSDDIRVTKIMTPIGFGYGRIIGVRNVVQAHIISEELGADLTDIQKFKLAEVIDKYQGGYFEAEYRDDSEIEYYKAIAEVTGKPGDAMKVRQITTSNLYKTSERLTGWELKAGILNNISSISYSYGTASDYWIDLFGSLEFAVPLDMNKQVIVSARYTNPLGDNNPGNPILNLTGLFTIDHSYTWSTTLRTDWTQVMPEFGDNFSNISFSLGTDYILFNNFSMDASFSYSSLNFVDLPRLYGVELPIPNWYFRSEVQTTNFHLGFSYYVM